MTYSDFDYVTEPKEFEYARRFGEILKKELHNEDDYEPDDYLSNRDSTIREIFDRHCVYLACKGQGGDEWRYLRSFTITSTMCHAILPRTDDGLSDEEVTLLKTDLGLALRSAEDVEVDISWQNKAESELKQLTNEELKAICRSYGRTFSNKKKDQLIATVKLGPVMTQSITEVEKVLKYSFLQPLGPQERSAHKLGSLNEERVRSVISLIVSNLDWHLVDAFECGLLRNKMREYLATSLDGWLVIKYNLGNIHSDQDDNDSVDPCPEELQEYNCGLEIKTPSSKQLMQTKIRQNIDLYGCYSQCEFGSEAFKQLVYKPEYRVQVLHHAVVANLKYVLFVVAGETKVQYAVLIRFPDSKLTTMKGILSGIYHRSLKWAYTTAWTTEQPLTSIPPFREDIISPKSYPITRDSILFSLIIWKKLLTMIQTTQLPLPKAHKILPVIVARWNRSKGRVDEMTRYLDGIDFPFPKGTPKQQLVMREFKKMAINVRFILKHCFPAKPPPTGKGYAAIQSHHKHMRVSMKDILFELASTYKIMNPIRGIVPGSPEGNACILPNIANDIDRRLEMENSGWQKKASQYVKERITPESRYKLKKFIDDEMLNKIRLDKTLFHLPKSHGSYIDSKTGRPTSIGKKAKEKLYQVQTEATEADISTEKVMKKIRKCPPRCVVCCAMADPKDKGYKITQTTLYCCTCLVSLCTKRKGNRRASCFEIFHQIQDLSCLRGKSSEAEENQGSSRKRKSTRN
jgi:hypothetical protein